ncbi:MAG: L-histidine N(alpha)-methyltransferase [Pseudomonadota bacterium]
MKKIEIVSRDRLEHQLAEHLRRAELPDHFMYLGASGAARWLRLAESPRFDIAARLEDLLGRHVEDFASGLHACCDVVSLGAGSGRKERLILDALVERGGRPRYFPIDVSAELVDMALAAAADVAWGGCGLVAPVEVLSGFAGKYFGTPMLLCMLGNSFCNHEPDWLLPLLRAQLGPEDHLLLDFHLVPEDHEAAEAEVMPRYNCQMNRDFNLGPLVERGLSPEACDFFMEVVPSAGLGWRTRKAILIKEKARVRCGSEVVVLEAGTELRLGFTYKYVASAVEELVARHGLEVRSRAASEDAAFALLLLRVADRGGNS